MKVFNTKLDEEIIFHQILANRSYLMGIAMLLVIVYHFFCWVYNPIGSLNIGYVGVDIFLFLSGLGLSYSYEKNTICRFYKNRIVRIYPVYFVAVTLTFIFVDWSYLNLLFNYLTIGFYTNGGIYRYDWYLESLFTLYFLFPLFYFFAKLRYYALFFSFIVVAFFLYIYHDFFAVAWHYNCFIARVPIFLYGIMFKHCIKSIKIICLIGIILFIPCRYMISLFLGSSLIAIPLIIFSLFLLSKINTSVKSCIEFCGTHSLELYCANCLIYKVIILYCSSLISKAIICILLQFVFSVVFIMVNKLAKKYIR